MITKDTTKEDNPSSIKSMYTPGGIIVGLNGELYHSRSHVNTMSMEARVRESNDNILSRALSCNLELLVVFDSDGIGGDERTASNMVHRNFADRVVEDIGVAASHQNLSRWEENGDRVVHPRDLGCGRFGEAPPFGLVWVVNQCLHCRIFSLVASCTSFVRTVHHDDRTVRKLYRFDHCLAAVWQCIILFPDRIIVIRPDSVAVGTVGSSWASRNICPVSSKCEDMVGALGIRN
ncbi:hypothetical protein KCU61_g533, partial [Aureobasidium melanogenum]